MLKIIFKINLRPSHKFYSNSFINKSNKLLSKKSVSPHFGIISDCKFSIDNLNMSEGSTSPSTKKPIEAADLPEVTWEASDESKKQTDPLILKDVVKRLEQIAPLSLAEPWDNVGLLIEPHDTKKPIKNILLTIDLTIPVLEEAVANKTDLIISYHPPIFVPVKRVNNSKWKERIISTCLAHNIAVFSPHTSWDTLQGGVNDWLGSIYSLKEYRPIQPIQEDHYGHMIAIGHKAEEAEDVEKHLIGLSKTVFGESYESSVSVNPVANSSTHVLLTDDALSKFLSQLYSSGKRFESLSVVKRPLSPSKTTGSGRFCTLKEPIPLLKAIKKMKAHLNRLLFRIALPIGKTENEIMVNTIAICAGSGGSLLKGTKADLIITGEMSHHEILDAIHNGVCVVLCEHSSSERGFLSAFEIILKHKLYNYLDDMNIEISNKDTEPVQYV